MTLPLPSRGTVASLIGELDRCESHAESLFSGLEAKQSVDKPPGGGWSIAECLEHLTLTTDAFLPLLRAAVQRLPAGGAPGRLYRLGMMGAILVWLMDPPFRVKTRTALRFEPRGIDPVGMGLAKFREAQERLRLFTRECDGKSLERTSIVSPFNSSVRYSVYDALCILVAHQRRHLFQATRVKARLSR